MCARQYELIFTPESKEGRDTHKSDIRLDLRIKKLLLHRVEYHTRYWANEEWRSLRDDAEDELVHEEGHEGSLAVMRD